MMRKSHRLPPNYDRRFDGQDQSETRHPHRGRTIFKRIMILILLAVALIIGFGVYLLIKLGVNPLSLGTLAADAGGRTNVLILGVGDPGHDGANLSDTNLVLSLDKPSGAVGMLSVPRDLRVDIPGYYATKINAANALGGPTLAEQTMSNTIDQPMQYYLVANFSALQRVVDAVGGLDVTVKTELKDLEYPCADNQYLSCGIDLKPGAYHMDGATVLEYTRCRKGTCGNDFGRAQRQQEIIGLLKAKLLTPAIYLNPVKLNQLATIWKTTITTNMSMNNLIRMVWFMQHSSHTTNLVLDESVGGYLRPDPAGSTDLLPVGGDFGRIQAAAKNIFGN